MEQTSEIHNNLREFLTGKFEDEILREDSFRGDHSFHVKPESVLDIGQALFSNDQLDFKYLVDITSVDWYGHAEEANGRFEIVYNFYSLRHKYRFFLKTRVPGDNPKIRSLTDLFAGANWLEREVWDLMGIEFEGHPELKKILTADDLEGHPLRRDFPLTWEQPRFTWNKDDPPEVVK